MAGEAPEAGGAHGDDDSEVAPAIGIEQDQDSGALAGAKPIPERERGWLISAQPTQSRL